MGYELHREVRAVLPPGKLTPLERHLILEIADQCDDDTREGWPGSKLLQLLIDKPERTVEETLKNIGKKWLELRVELGKGADGRPYYSHRGKATTFRIPTDAEMRAAYEKATGIPWASSASAAMPGAIRKPKKKAPRDSGASEGKPPTFPEEAPDFSGESPPESRGPSPQSSSPQNCNTSSLSSARTSVPGPRNPADDRERDESTSSADPNSNTPAALTAAQRMLAKHGVHGVEADQAESFIRRNVPAPIQGDGWWYRAGGNGSLADWLDRWRESLTTTTSTDIEPATPCPMHSRFPLYACQVCAVTVASGGDPFEGRTDRPADWWNHYNRQVRSSERPNACADNAGNWLTLPTGGHQPYTNPDPSEYDDWTVGQSDILGEIEHDRTPTGGSLGRKFAGRRANYDEKL